MKNIKNDMTRYVINEINLYSDGIEILEEILKLYINCFSLSKGYSEESNRIIDYEIEDIEKYKNNALSTFYNIIENQDYMYLELLQDGINFKEVLNNIENFKMDIIINLNQFFSFWRLELETYIEKNNMEFFKDKRYIFLETINSIESFINDMLNVTLDKGEVIVINKLEYEILNFNKSTFDLIEEIKKIVMDKYEIHSLSLNERLIILSDRFLDNIDELENNIKVILKNEFFIESLMNIDIVVEEEIKKLINKYKRELNKLYAYELNNKKSTLKNIYNFESKIIDMDKIYEIFIEIISLEKDYLKYTLDNFIKKSNLIENELKYNLSRVFYNEFYRVVYDINSIDDLILTVESLDIKVNCIIYNMVTYMMTIFESRYNSTIYKLRKRINIIENKYIFKPIKFFNSYSIYNIDKVQQLQEKLFKLYNGYNKFSIDINIDEVLYYGDNFKNYIEHFIEKIKLDRNNYNFDIELLFKIKKYLLKNIKMIEDNIWMTMDIELRNKFNYLNDKLVKDIDIIKSDIRIYESELSYNGRA